MSDLLQPDQIFAGRYKVVAFLAKGGFGAVYSAEQLDTEAKVALKVLWPHLLDSVAVEQFKLEAKVSNRIASEHVVRVYDVGQEVGTGKVYLSMELLEGKNLEELVKERGPVAPRDAAVYFRQIASALEKAHNYVDRNGNSRSIVHRDLKPENLFLTHRENGEPCVKILDFGLAKVLGESGRTSNEFKGTLLFMSYEQAAVGVITPQTDIWALGLIAFYLLTGRCYWLSAVDTETPVTRIFSEVLSGPIIAPSERAHSLGASAIPSPAFDAWFARTVTRNTAHRFGSIAECVAELLKVLDAMPAASAPRGVIPVVPAPPDTAVDAVLYSAAAPEVLQTLRSAHPHSSAGVETPSSQSLELALSPAPSPSWRGLALVAVVAGLIGAGLLIARFQPSQPAASLSSGPDLARAGGAGPRTTTADGGVSARGASSLERLPALPLPGSALTTDPAANRPPDPARSANASEASPRSGGGAVAKRAAGARPPYLEASPRSGGGAVAKRAAGARPPYLEDSARAAPAPSSAPDEDPYGSR